MMTTSSELTLQLATAFGAYMIAGGLGGLISRDRWIAFINDFDGASALAFITGVFVYVVGVAIILAHNVWTDFVAGLISLVGWVAAAEGLILIAAPGVLLSFSKLFLRPALITGFAAFTVIGGVLLVIAGLTGTVR